MADPERPPRPEHRCTGGAHDAAGGHGAAGHPDTQGIAVSPVARTKRTYRIPSMHSVRQASAGAMGIGRVLVAAGAVACTSTPAPPPVGQATPASTSPDVAGRATREQGTLGGTWLEMRDSARATSATWYLSLSFSGDGTARVVIGDIVEGRYEVAGTEVTVVGAGGTSVARVPLGGPGGRAVPLRYEMRRDTLWWQGGGSTPVPLRAWVPALERERRLPAGAWFHAWPNARGRASLQLSAGGCARFVRATGTLTRPYRVDGDTLWMGFGGFLGLPERSRLSLRGDTLELDFMYAGAGAPQPIQLRFVRHRYEILDLAARCEPPQSREELGRSSATSSARAAGVW